MLFRTVLAVSAIAIGVTAALAQQDPIKARKDLMAANAEKFYGVIGRMQRGQIPYDQANVDAAIAAVTDNAPKIAAAFASNAMPATQSDYDASPKIWQNKADFDTKAADFVNTITGNRNAITNIDTLKGAYQNINSSCNACHELYRVKNR